MIDKTTAYKKTFSIGSLCKLLLVFILIIIVLSFVRGVKIDGIMSEIKDINSEIEKLTKQKNVLIAEEKKYGAPNRFIEIGIESGLIEPRGENDILYIEINKN